MDQWLKQKKRIMRLLYPATGLLYYSDFVGVFLVEAVQNPGAGPVEICKSIGVKEKALYLPVSGFDVTVVYATGVNNCE